MSVPTFEQAPVQHTLPAVVAHPGIPAPQFVYQQTDPSTMIPNMFNNADIAPPTFSNLDQQQFQSQFQAPQYTQNAFEAPPSYLPPQQETDGNMYTNEPPMTLTSFDLTPRMQSMLAEKYREYMAEYGGDDSYDPNQFAQVINPRQQNETYPPQYTNADQQEHVYTEEEQDEQQTQTAIDEETVYGSRQIDMPEEKHTQKSQRSKVSSCKCTAQNNTYGQALPRYKNVDRGVVHPSSYDSKYQYSHLPMDKASMQPKPKNHCCAGNNAGNKKKSKHCC